MSFCMFEHKLRAWRRTSRGGVVRKGERQDVCVQCVQVCVFSSGQYNTIHSLNNTGGCAACSQKIPRSKTVPHRSKDRYAAFSPYVFRVRQFQKKKKTKTVQLQNCVDALHSQAVSTATADKASLAPRCRTPSMPVAASLSRKFCTATK